MAEEVSEHRGHEITYSQEGQEYYQTEWLNGILHIVRTPYDMDVWETSMHCDDCDVFLMWEWEDMEWL